MSAPIAASASVSDTTTALITVALPGQSAEGQRAIVRVVARVTGDVTLSSLTTTGPVFGEVNLSRVSDLNVNVVHLDEGFMRAGYGRGTDSVIGMMGLVHYETGDQVTVAASNFTGGALVVILEVTVKQVDKMAGEVIYKLSTEQEALFEWQATYTEIATPGSPVIDLTVGAGDQLRLNSAKVKWTTGAAEGIIVNLIDDQATPILLSTLATIASGATVTANLTTFGSAPNTSANMGGSFGVVLRTGVGLRVTDNGGTPTLNDVLLISISGMIKGIPPTIADNGTGNKATESVKYKRVR